MSPQAKRVPQPPQPPQAGRRLRFHATQLIGVPLIAIIPILALLHVFGTTHETEIASDDPLLVEVRYPTRFRYKTIDPLDVTVRNTGSAPLRGVSVRIDKGYVEAFSTVSFTPSPQRVTSDAFVFDLGDIPPGEARVVDGLVQAERYWRHPGRITVRSDGGAEVALDVATFTFP